ncbi:hypothetical protein Hoch_0121 [Haliangium ochraceum DSM 14365]|uniref:Uncharacterized protein n=2 Tax=Haliangium ochraceum TaxID=80816 RepID=D0LGL6_HALO1|nr:hypothetical protein Hoch_0121 [Haliangium ochraceum DSM 14365]
MLLTLFGLLSCVYFVFAFKFVRSEYGRRSHPFQPTLPRAVLRHNAPCMGRRWVRGRRRQQSLVCARQVQIGIVAIGMTAAFVMFLCMAGIMLTVLIGTL